jgi:hypothetical protein
MLEAIFWQSTIRGEPSEDWFSKVELPQSLTLLRASREAGAALATARMVARTVRGWKCMMMMMDELLG